MTPIRIETLASGSRAVQPDDERWRLLVDEKGYPHLYVQVNVEDDNGQVVKGYVCLDDMLPDEMTIENLMDGGVIGGKLSPEEEAEAARSWVARNDR